MTARTGTDITRAAELLRSGHLVAFPTETVYGLGASALDPVAAARIFEAKQRPRFDPLIVHLHDADQLSSLVAEIPPAAQKLIDRFWPGPLTVVLPKQTHVPDLVSSGLPTVGVRVPRHPLARKLLHEAGIPVAAPSANRFGSISPTTATHVTEQLGEHVEYVLDGGPCEIGLESTVVTFDADEVIVLRPGGTTLEQLREVTAKVRISEATGSEEQPASPGRTLRHYAPSTPIVIRPEGLLHASEAHLATGLITNRTDPAPDFRQVERLDTDLRQAASGFFAALRRLDDAGLDLIVATPFPNEGLGVALNDRLNRAAARG